MIGKIFKKLNNEDGAVHIVEATFVFPIMFIILFFLIYMGNAYYVKAQVEAIVTEEAVKGAAYCVDPILENLKENGAVPKLSELEMDPYRYIGGIFGADKTINNVENKIGREVEQRINGSSVTLFRNMEPVVKTSRSKIANYNNHIFYSTFSVEVKCEVEFPIKFFGSSTPTMVEINSRSEVAVNDTSEFIRNTDMVIDYFGDSKLGQSIKSVFDKINGFLTEFAG